MSQGRRDDRDRRLSLRASGALDPRAPRSDEHESARDEDLDLLAHELRNPLTAIVWAVQSMQRRDDAAIQRELDVIDRHTRRLVAVVNELLLVEDERARERGPGTPLPAPGRVGPATKDRTAERVLVVDDNVDAAELLAEHLRGFGHEALTAYDGPSALEAAESFEPTVAVLDIDLPGMDGWEVARRLRQSRSQVRLLAVSGYGREEHRARSVAAGMDAHLVKPVDLRDLDRAIARPPRLYR